MSTILYYTKGGHVLGLATRQKLYKAVLTNDIQKDNIS